MWQYLYHYPILNLRFMLRFLSITNNFVLIVILCTELFHPVQDLIANNGIEKNAFGGTECENYRGRLRLPADMWNIYAKILSLVYNIWLFYRISVIFFPLARGNWLYDNQEKLYTFRTTLIIVAGFNILPLMVLGLLDCVYAQYYFLIAPWLIFFALLIDRIFVRANDYFQLSNDAAEIIPQRQWQEQDLWKGKSNVELAQQQKQPLLPSSEQQQSSQQPSSSKAEVPLPPESQPLLPSQSESQQQ